jgi:DNA polymerase III subunit beta
MHIELKREELQSALELVGRVSTKHITLPVLQCVLVEVGNDVVRLTATNLEIGVEVAITSNKATEEERFAVPAVTLLQTISLLTDQYVSLATEGDVLVVEGKKAKTNIKLFPYEEFPTIPKVSGDGQVINKDMFSLGIKTTAFACSISSIKPELGSVYIFQKKEHSVTFVATDSFRLIEKTVPQKGVILNESLLVPQKNALELTRVCDLATGDVSLKVNDNQCALAFTDGVYITSRLTNGNFPDYEQIIPKEYTAHVTILKQDLINAFKRSQVFLNKFLQVGIHVTNGSLTITANNGEVGTTTETISAATEGEELTLNFNQRYVSESLGHFTDDSIILHFAGVGRPLVITGAHDTTTRYLVMPMNK